MKLNAIYVLLLALLVGFAPARSKADDGAITQSNAAPVFQDGLNWPRLRHDWTDVLINEDPSQPESLKPITSYSDIKGATFSYSRNGKNDSDNWSADGALIVPWIYRPELAWYRPTIFAIAPSVTIFKVSDSAKPTNNVDHLDFRIGFYTKLLARESDRFRGSLQVRTAFVYGSDSNLRASLPAGELDIEPQLAWFVNNPGSSFMPDWFSIGYPTILIGSRKDNKVDDIVDFKIRTWLHLEGGHLQQNGTNWDAVNGSFFRLGPNVQGTLDFPTFLNGFSASAQYGYLPAISGPNGETSLYTLSAALTLYKNDARHQKISLTSAYTKGGLTLSKQPVDTLNVGIGVIF